MKKGYLISNRTCIFLGISDLVEEADRKAKQVYSNLRG